MVARRNASAPRTRRGGRGDSLPSWSEYVYSRFRESGDWNGLLSALRRAEATFGDRDDPKKAPTRRSPGRPRKVAGLELRESVATLHEAMRMAIKQFRLACRGHGTHAPALSKGWDNLSKREAVDLLKKCGFPDGLADILAELRPKQLLPNGGQPRRLAYDLVRVQYLDRTTGRPTPSELDIREALRGRRTY